MDELLSKEFSLGELEDQMISGAMERAGGNVTRAASLLGLSRAALDYRLKKAASGGN